MFIDANFCEILFTVLLIQCNLFTVSIFACNSQMTTNKLREFMSSESEVMEKDSMLSI